MPGRSFRFRRFAMAAILGFAGLWCIYDGYYAWPREVEEARANKIEEKFLPHTALDIKLNQWLGIVLPAASLIVLGHCLYASRGTCRLSNHTLHVPGHEPIHLSQVRSIDMDLWDRKGIAFVVYDARGGNLGRAKLDDFLYDQDAIERMVRMIEGHLAHVPEPTASIVPPDMRPQAIPTSLKAQRTKLTETKKRKSDEYPRMKE